MFASQRRHAATAAQPRTQLPSRASRKLVTLHNTSYQSYKYASASLYSPSSIPPSSKLLEGATTYCYCPHPAARLWTLLRHHQSLRFFGCHLILLQPCFGASSPPSPSSSSQ